MAYSCGSDRRSGLGLYATRYHDKTPQIYFRGLNLGVPAQYFNVIRKTSRRSERASAKPSLRKRGRRDFRAAQHAADSEAQVDPFVSLRSSAPTPADNRHNPLYAVAARLMLSVVDRQSASERHCSGIKFPRGDRLEPHNQREAKSCCDEP